MNTPEAAQGTRAESASELYLAFELGEKSWKLSLGDGARGPSRYAVAAGDTAAVLECIVKAKARCGLARKRECAAVMKPDATDSGCTAGLSNRVSTIWWSTLPASR